jgi:hypothetical protein
LVQWSLSPGSPTNDQYVYGYPIPLVWIAYQCKYWERHVHEVSAEDQGQLQHDLDRFVLVGIMFLRREVEKLTIRFAPA